MADKIAVTVDEVFSRLPLEQASLIKNYLTLLFKWHATDNIVSSSNEEYVIKREIYDSSILSKFVSGSSFTDVGSGGGIPGIILAILNLYCLLQICYKFVNYLLNDWRWR